MSMTQANPTTATHEPGVTAAPMKFEVTTLPVADVDRAKAFYQGLGWRLIPPRSLSYAHTSTASARTSPPSTRAPRTPAPDTSTSSATSVPSATRSSRSA
jgi:hypothetical protein